MTPARRTRAPVLRALFLALPVLAGCAATPPPDAPRTVQTVDLARYAGLWHEVSRFPNWFQDGRGVSCADTTATYEPRPDGRIGVVNRCRNAAAGGAERAVEGRAYAVEGSGGSRLRVSFFWPFYGDYWVLGLSPDYRWAVVGDPRREYLWVLSRTPTMAEADYAAALAVARREGFDTARLRPTARLGI
jgi:apolipoprotein D and lipocalin family protein